MIWKIIMKTIKGRDLMLILYPPIILSLTPCIFCSLRPVWESENIKRFLNGLYLKRIEIFCVLTY